MYAHLSVVCIHFFSELFIYIYFREGRELPDLILGEGNVVYIKVWYIVLW